MATTYTPNLDLPKHDTADPFDITLINNAMDILDNEVGSQKTGLSKRDRVYNLLDNSDFANPVNQGRQTSYTGVSDDTIDRWRAGSANCSMILNSGSSVGFATTTEGASAYWRQILPWSFTQLKGKTFTLALCDASGSIYAASGTYPTTAPTANESVAWVSVGEGITFVLYCQADGTPFVQFSTTKETAFSVKWVSMYEGAYTVNTLPTYQPKDYAVEWAACRRLRKRYTTIQLPVTFTVAGWCAAAIDYTDMRLTPSLSYELAGLYVGGNVYTSVTDITLRALPASELLINTGVNIAANQTGTIRFNRLDLSVGL